MQTNTDTPPAEDHEDRSDHYKPLLVAELDRLAKECAQTDDWFEGQKMALRVFRAAPHPNNAEPARHAFKVLVNAMQGRDDQGVLIPDGVSAAYVQRLRNELLALLGITQSELFGPEDVFLKIDANGIAPAPELKAAVETKTEAQKLREEAAELRKKASDAITDAQWSDAPGAVQIAKEDAEVDRRRADELDSKAAELEGGAK